MTDTQYIALSIIVMVVITYLIRMLPLVIFRKKIKSRYIRSFLFYVPYAVLAAMTFPAIFAATGSTVTAVVGTMVALILSFLSRTPMIIIVIGSALAAFLAGFIF